MKWFSDDRGNKCSDDYFESESAAREALASLKNCDNCINCSRCSGCSRCSDLKNASPLDGEALTLPSIPVVENLHQKLYAAASAPEALNMGQWHTCEKKHCRAGWVITLAGKEGRALEERFDTFAEKETTNAE